MSTSSIGSSLLASYLNTGSSSTGASGIDASVLSAYYSAKAGLSSTSTSTSATSVGVGTTNPTPPWASSAAPTSSALTKSVLAGGAFVNPSAAKLDVNSPSPTATANYKDLFTTYQGLSALQGLAQQAQAANTSPSQLAALQATFARGLGEVQGYLATDPFKGLSVAYGTLAVAETSTVGEPVTSSSYTSPPLTSGSYDTPLSNLPADSRFNLTLTSSVTGKATTVAFDLSDLGSTPPTLSNVVSYLNGKLADAKVTTRFAVQTTPGVAQTTTAGGKTVSLGTTSPTTYSLQLKGVSFEQASFSAPAATPAVYVAQTSGVTAADATAIAPADATQQLLKLSTDPDAASTDGQIFGHTLPSNVTAVRASVTGADGSLYVLADVSSATSDGQTIKGSGDVALLKYDSVGDLAFTRTLGASNSASGYALALSGDGSKIAVAGSVTGALTGTTAIAAASSSTSSDSFVSVYSTAAGDEQWTARTGSSGADVAKGVAFGSDGAVYVTGEAQGSVAGAASQGGQDAYLQSFKATAVSNYDGTTSYSVLGSDAVQFGSAGLDRAAGVVTTASGAVVTASVENGHAILRSYAQPLTANAQPVAERDLGALNGGTLAGISLAADGSIVVAGSTHNGALNAGAVTTAYSGGQQAFVAKLSADLQPAGSDKLSYLNTGGDGDATASAVTVAGGQVYVAGQIAASAGTKGYVEAIDPDTGQSSFLKAFAGTDGRSAPTTVAVDASNATILDSLGLPRGAVNTPASQLVTSATSARAGDQFVVRLNGGAAQTITLAKDDTYKTLAAKINRALGYAANATVATSNGKSELRIAPQTGLTGAIELQAGPTGKNALAALGLTEGVVSTAVKAGVSSSAGKTYALTLASSLNLSTPDAAKAASKALSAAIGTVQRAYTDLITPASTTSAGSGTVPAYLTAQIANYQLALARLTGASS